MKLGRARLGRKAAFAFSVGVSLLFLAGLLFSTLGDLPTAVSALCDSLTALLPIVGMLMVLVAAVVYALGQIMGAETRARGNVWATACLGGALMAFLIVAVAPPVLGAIFGGGFNCSGGAPGGLMCGSIPYDPSTSSCCPTAGDEHVCSLGRCCVSGCQFYDPGPPPGWVC